MKKPRRVSDRGFFIGADNTHCLLDYIICYRNGIQR
mgnify:CR=1 FL=1